MRPGREACAAHIAYNLALLYTAPLCKPLGIAAKVHIGGGIDGVMPYFYGVSSSSRPSLKDYHAISYCHYRSALRGSIIHAGMGTDNLKDRMSAAVGESGGYSEKVERSLKEGLAQALPLLVPIEAALLSILVVYSKIGLAGVIKLRIPDIAYIHRLTLKEQLVVEGCEGVSLLQGEEVYGPGIYVGNLKRQQG